MADPEIPERKPARRRSSKAKAVEQAARGYFEAVAARDLDAMAGYWHDEIVGDILAIGVFRGPGELRAFFAELFAAVPDFEFTVTRLAADDRVAYVEWRIGGTFDSGVFQGFEPTGRRIELRGIDCAEIEDGKVVHNTVYYDGLAFARGIGMLPAEDSAPERAMVAGFNAVTKLRRTLKEISR